MVDLRRLSAKTCSAFTSFEIATDGAVTCLPMVSVANTLPSSPEKECCATFPKERMIAITAAALNRGIKRPVSVKRFAFYYRRLHLCQNTCIKVFAQSYFLLNLLINKQILIAKQMSRNFFLCEEVAQCCSSSTEVSHCQYRSRSCSISL